VNRRFPASSRLSAAHRHQSLDESADAKADRVRHGIKPILTGES
jgi:hypothetical protein